MANTPIVSMQSRNTMSVNLSKIEEGAIRFHDHGEMFYSPSIFQKIIAELVGTYILIFAGCGSALADRDHPLAIVGIALVLGLVLVALIYAGGHVSGAHFNPAVTIGFATTARFSLVQVPIYVLTQLLGSTLACLSLRVLSVTVAIGVTLTVDVLVAGPITDASMNPARSIGPALVSGEYKIFWVFILAPILRAIAATLTYSLLQPRKQIEENADTKRVNNDLYEH